MRQCQDMAKAVTVEPPRAQEQGLDLWQETVISNCHDYNHYGLCDPNPDQAVSNRQAGCALERCACVEVRQTVGLLLMTAASVAAAIVSRPTACPLNTAAGQPGIATLSPVTLLSLHGPVLIDKDPTRRTVITPH